MTQAPPMGVDDINLANPELFQNDEAHAAFRLLRAHRPVHWNTVPEPFKGFWNITRYDDIIAVSREPNLFISSKGITMFVDEENPSEAAGLGKMIITMDPPRHVRMRRLVNKGFTPRAVGLLEPHVREITNQIIDDVIAKGSCDFVVDVAAKLPLAVICGMMGVPKEGWDLMFEITNKVLGSDDPEYQTATAASDAADPLADESTRRGKIAQETAEQGQRELFGFFMRLLMERKAQRNDDLVSVLVDADVDGEKLTDEDILFFAYLLILAGNETTRNAISGGILAFMENRDQWERLQREPELLPVAIEEVLRWVSPVMHMARVATQDAVVGGQQIAKGDRLILWYPSGNRDAAIFPDADTFDMTRTPNDHIAFGLGEHFCLGAGLARQELRVMYEQLLRRMPDIHLAGPPERLRSTFIGGIKHMPVEFTAVR